MNIVYRCKIKNRKKISIFNSLQKIQGYYLSLRPHKIFNPSHLFVPLINRNRKMKSWSHPVSPILDLNKTRNTKDAILVGPKQDFLLHINTTYPQTKHSKLQN